MISEELTKHEHRYVELFTNDRKSQGLYCFRCMSWLDARTLSASDASFDEQKERIAALEKAGRTVIEGFERKMFCRNIEHDADSGWVIKFAPYLKALAELSEHPKEK